MGKPLSRRWLVWETTTSKGLVTVSYPCGELGPRSCETRAWGRQQFFGAAPHERLLITHGQLAAILAPHGVPQVWI